MRNVVARWFVLVGINSACTASGCAATVDGPTAASEEAETLTPLVLTNMGTGKVLEIGGGQPQDGARANQWAFTNDIVHYPWQAWGLRATGNGEFEIVNHATNKCLEIGGFSGQNGASANQWTCAAIPGNVNQRWKFVPVPKQTNVYTIRNVGSGKCLEIGGGVAANGAFANQWDCVGLLHQSWNIPIPHSTGPTGPSCTPPGTIDPYASPTHTSCCSGIYDYSGRCG